MMVLILSCNWYFVLMGDEPPQILTKYKKHKLIGIRCIKSVLLTIEMRPSSNDLTDNDDSDAGFGSSSETLADVD